MREGKYVFSFLSVNTNESPSIFDMHVDDVNLSDHFFITFKAQCMVFKSEYKTFHHRNLKSIDIDLFRNELTDTLNQLNQSDFGAKIDFYNTQLRALLDKHAPLKKKMVKIVPNAPWFDAEYRELRKKRRKAEK